jgi:hypothetical protein
MSPEAPSGWDREATLICFCFDEIVDCSMHLHISTNSANQNSEWCNPLIMLFLNSN